MKLNEDGGDVQVSTLIYAMGYKAENVIKTLAFPTRDCKNDFDFVLKKFDE